MSRPRKLVLLLTLGLVVTGAPAATAGEDDLAPQTALADASLKIKPKSGYVGGQALRWSGSLGERDSFEIVLQRHLGRAGDDWEVVEDFEGTTNDFGEFSFWYGAPAMRGIKYRVATSDGFLVTPHVVLMALQPDLVLWVSGDDPADPEDVGSAVAGTPFGVSVDTTPELSEATSGLTPLVGRKLTLQRRVAGTGDEWDRLGRAKVDKDGMGYFRGLVEQEAGEVVYRVRQEDWKKGRDDIGWQPSFPTPIAVARTADDAGPASAPGVPAAGADLDTSWTTSGADDGMLAPGDSAAAKYRWYPALYDFAWVKGESLTSPPFRGKDPKGWWLDYTDGTGRVSKDGGGLLLDSQRSRKAGPGDLGTMKATLQEHPITLGRFETKLELRTLERGARDYEVRLELVPDGDQEDACRTVTVAAFDASSSRIDFGVNADDLRWTGSTTMLEDINNFAVEITEDHMTWFLNGTPIGTVDDPDALLGIPFTQRISLVGGGTADEMNRSLLKSDWERGFDLARGTQVADGPAMTEDALQDC